MTYQKKKRVVLSASRLKTLESCSFLYYAKYILRLPETGNDGSARGSVVHKLFECLLNPRHKKHYDSILNNGSIKGLTVIERFIRWQGKREKISGDFDHKGSNNLDLIDEMILVGLKSDFFCEEGRLESPETEFNYEDEELGFSIRGFIDKISIIDKRGKESLQIWDYKTSAEKFSGEDLDSNSQALMYSLYAKRVRNMDAIVRFIFLRFPDGPICELDFSSEEIEGFAKYLSYVSKYLSNFNQEKAKMNMAADQKYPAKNEGFKGPLVCGYAKFPGHTSKSGKVYWHCSHKFAYDYYKVVDAEGNIISTYFNKEDAIVPEGAVLSKERYKGCPAISQNF